MEYKNQCIPHGHALLDQTTRQPLRNFMPQKPWKYQQLWEMSYYPTCLWKKCTGNYVRQDIPLKNDRDSGNNDSEMSKSDFTNPGNRLELL